MQAKNSKGDIYVYKNKIREGLIIDKKIREDFTKFCREKKLIKSKIVEKLYKAVNIKFREGSMNQFNGYVTIDILDKSN